MKSKEILSGILLSMPFLLAQTAYGADITEETRWYNKGQTMTIIPGVDVGGSGVKSVEYNMDNAGWQEYVEPFQVGQTMLVSMRALDYAGNYSETRTVTVRIDTLPPGAPSIHTDKLQANDKVAFTLTPGADGESGIKGCEYQIKIKGNSADVSDWLTDTGSGGEVTDEGEYTIYARTIDNADNTSQAVSIDVLIDKTAPTKPGIGLDNAMSSDQIVITITPGSDNKSGVKKTEYRLLNATDNSVIVDWTVYTTPPTITSEGKYIVEVRTVDNVDNISEVASEPFEIDKTAPTEPTISANQEISNDQISFSISDGIDNGVGVERTEYRVLNSVSGAILIDWSTFSVSQILTDEGTYKIEARSIDKVNNISAVAEKKLIIDKTPPDKIEIPTDNISPETGMDKDKVEIIVPDPADPDDEVYYAAVDQGSSIPPSEDSSWKPVEDNKITITDEGAYDVYIKVVDPAGNEVLTGPIQVTVDRSAPADPVITLTPDKTLHCGDIIFAIAGDETDVSGVEKTEYRILSTDDGVVLVDWTIYTTEQTITDDGRYTIEAKSTDKLGNVSNVASISLEIDTTPPDKIEIPADNISPETGMDKDKVEIIVPDPADPDDEVYYAAVDQGSSIPPSEDSSWKPVEDNKITITDEGAYDVYIKVVDPAGNEVLTGPIQVTVDRSAPADPVITLTPDKTLHCGDITFAIAGDMTDVSGVEKTEYRILSTDNREVLVDWTIYTTEQTITDDGRYTIEAKSTDKLSNVSNVASISLEIDTTPPDKIEITEDNLSPSDGKDRDQVIITVPDSADLSDNVDYVIVDKGEPMPPSDDDRWKPVEDNKITITDEGAHDVYIKVTDQAGNETVTGPIQVIIDRTAPGAVIFNGVLPNQWGHGTRVTMKAEDNVGIQDILYWTSYDPTKQSALSAPIESNFADGRIEIYRDHSVAVKDGEYTIYAQAVDQLDNQGPESSIDVKIDGADPSLTITDGGLFDQDFTITMSAGDSLRSGSVTNQPSGVGGIRFALQTPDGAWVRDQTYTDPIQCFMEGEYHLEAYAYDNAGNQSVLQQKNYVLDRSAPIIQAVQAAKGQFQKSPAVVTIIAIDKTAMQYSFDGGVSWHTENTMSYHATTTIPAGKIMVCDALGHVTPWPNEVVAQVIVPDNGDDNNGNAEGSDGQDPAGSGNQNGQGNNNGSSNTAGLETSGGIDSTGDTLYLNEGIALKADGLEKGYIAGYEDESFRGESNITRAETEAFLYRVLDVKITSPKIYADVPKDFWAATDIQILQGRSLMPDFGEQFRPDDELTKEELAATLDSALALDKFNDKEDLKITDLTKADIQYQGAVKRVARAGLMSVTANGQFDPKAPITRAETVKILNHVFGLDLDNVTKQPAFKDVSTSDWYYNELKKAAAGKAMESQQEADQ